MNNSLSLADDKCQHPDRKRQDSLSIFYLGCSEEHIFWFLRKVSKTQLSLTGAL